MRAPDPRSWSIPGNAAEEKTLIVLTICSTKGGVGKTTLTANLAGFLSDAGDAPEKCCRIRGAAERSALIRFDFRQGLRSHVVFSKTRPAIRTLCVR